MFVGVVLVVASLAAYDYFWGSPQANDLVVIESTIVSAGTVTIEGTTASSALHYRRYSAKVRDGRMTIMLRWSLLNSSGGDFDISIPTRGAQVNEVYLYDGTSERRVYP